MPHLSTEDRELSKSASGLSQDPPGPWKHRPTPIDPPSNNMRRTAVQTPYGKGRFADGINSLRSGNPNSTRTVFGQERGSKPRRTREASKPTIFSLEQRPLDKSIDLTKDDTDTVIRSSTAADDSEDSLNLGAEKRSKARIAGDGRATQRLKAGPTGGKSSDVINSDTETELIEEYPSQPRNKGKGQTIIRNIESKNAPKLQLTSNNPLDQLSPVNLKSKIRFRPLITPAWYTNGSKGKGKTSPALPLTDWVRGTEHLQQPSQHFLGWEVEQGSPILKVTSAKGRQELKINMRSGVRELQASSLNELPLIIEFVVSDLRQNPTPEFLLPGSDYSHCVMAFRVDTEDEACNAPMRKALYEFLRDKCGCKLWLSSGNSATAWNGIVQTLNPVGTPQSKEPNSPLSAIPKVGRGDEWHSPVSSYRELPSIGLPPPPKVQQMHPSQTTTEQRVTGEIAEDEQIAGPSHQPQRRSLRQATLRFSSSTTNATHTLPSEDPDELVLVYRPLAAGAVNVTRGDLDRLQPGKYLNDTLIEFGLKLWLNDLRDHDPELADQIHLFSSFFYKKLAIKDKRAGYESVRKWTSRVDVFSKKYLVVPINEHLHWYLAIICQPEYTLRPAPPSNSPMTRKRKRDEELSVGSAIEGMGIDDSTTNSLIHVDREVHIEDLTGESTPHGTTEPSVAGTEDATTEAPAVEMEDSTDIGPIPVQTFYGNEAAPSMIYTSETPRASAPAKLEGGPQEGDLRDAEIVPLNTDHTYIFVFDSLNGKHPGAMKNLAQYLRYEAMDKKEVDSPSSPETMAALVPTQDNYCDCGLYLLHFAKVFMEDPVKSFHTILTKRKTSKADREVDWKKESVGISRENLTRKILELSEIWVKQRAKEAEEKAKAKEREGTSKPESIAVDSPEDSDSDVVLEGVVVPKPEPRKKPRSEPTKKGAPGRLSFKMEAEPTKPERAAAERIQ